MKLFARLLVLLALMIAPAHASQNSIILPTVSPYPGLTMLGNINSANNTLATHFSGSSAPSGAQTDQFWFDSTNSLLKIYDGTNWYPIGYMSGGWIATSNGFKQIAVTSTGSANAYVVAYSPAPTAYVTGQIYTFITNFANTTTATANINGLGAKTLKKQGGTNLASGDLGSGIAVSAMYDGTNLQIISALSTAASGTVTSVACGTGLSGGTITSSGTCAFATIGSNTILANNTGSAAIPIGTSLTALLDANLGSTQGDVAYRNATGWVVLPPGTNGQALLTGGTSANVSWGNVSSLVTAYAYFDGSGNIQSNSNVSSVTHVASGTYTVNFTTAFPDSKYGMNCTCASNSVGYQNSCSENPAVAARGTTSVTVQSLAYGGSGVANVDMPCTVTILGQ